MIRSIVHAFDDDGVLLHNGGGCVVAHARHGLRHQLIGTGIRHDLHRHHRCMPSSAVVHVASCVIKATFGAPLISSLRFALRGSLTAAAAVNLPAIIRLAKVHDLPAFGAANPHKDLHLHARTSTAALIEVAPLVCSRAPSPGQRPRATRRLRIRLLGLHPFCGPRSPTRPRSTSPLLGNDVAAPFPADLGDRQQLGTKGTVVERGIVPGGVPGSSDDYFWKGWQEQFVIFDGADNEPLQTRRAHFAPIEDWST